MENDLQRPGVRNKTDARGQNRMACCSSRGQRQTKPHETTGEDDVETKEKIVYVIYQ